MLQLKSVLLSDQTKIELLATTQFFVDGKKKDGYVYDQKKQKTKSEHNLPLPSQKP